MSNGEATVINERYEVHKRIGRGGMADVFSARDLLLDRFTTRPEVSRLQTHIVFRHHRRPVRPALARPLAHSPHRG